MARGLQKTIAKDIQSFRDDQNKRGRGFDHIGNSKHPEALTP